VYSIHFLIFLFSFREEHKTRRYRYFVKAAKQRASVRKVASDFKSLPSKEEQFITNHLHAIPIQSDGARSV